MKILIQNGHVVDPLTGVDEVCDVLVRDTDIEKVEKNGRRNFYSFDLYFSQDFIYSQPNNKEAVCQHGLIVL